MREGAKDFYQKLCKEEFFLRPSLDNLHFRVLEADSSSQLEAPFTEEEILIGLRNCCGDKGPGLDGFNLKFLQVF